MKAKVYIPTKGRADESYTAKTLSTFQIPFILVVEPQDEASYRKYWPLSEIAVMPLNDQGVSYARNYCKQLSKARGEKYHWQLDDDIKHFYRRDMVRQKNDVTTPEPGFNSIEREVMQYKNVAMAGFVHSAFAFGMKNDINYNKMVYCVMLINNHVPINFKKGTSEDVDYSLRCLMNDWVTMNFSRFMFAAYTQKVPKGGCQEIEYGNGGRERMNKQLEADFPGVFVEYKKDGVSRIKPSRIWRQFEQRPVKIGEEIGPDQPTLF